MSKRHDYTSSEDEHENFKRTEILLTWFNSPIDKPYIALIGTKLARLASLLDMKEPKNESIEDTFLDLVNYCALWSERRTTLNVTTKDESKLKCSDFASDIYQNRIYCILTKGHEGDHKYRH